MNIKNQNIEVFNQIS